MSEAGRHPDDPNAVPAADPDLTAGAGAAATDDPEPSRQQRRQHAGRSGRWWNRFVQWWDPTKLWGAVVVGVAVSVLSSLIVAKVQPTPPTPDADSDSGSSGQVNSCHFSTRGGLLYAGHSSTTTRLVDTNGGEKNDAYEVQCLLQHAKISPGAIDGSFGQRTEKAVEQAQKTRPGATVDGEVGHQTWIILRTMK